jgi:hypothetical protein
MTLTYRWQRCTATGGSCATISGATTATYTPVIGDVGSPLRGVVTATNQAGSASASSSLTATVVSAALPPPVIASELGGNGFGVASGGSFEWLSDADLARQLDGSKELGAGWLRTDFKWSVVEGTKGVYNWANYDRVVNAAKARGLNVIFSVAYTPGWAGPAGATDDKYAPANVADYANFAKVAVQHYSPMGVKIYELWNEPNLPAFWKPAPDPVKYTALVKAAYPAMKTADPAITVLAGSFSPAGGYNDPNCNGTSSSIVNGLTFLERMYQNGAKGSFDALSFHPYYGGAGITDIHRCNSWAQMATTSPSLRSFMTANGDGDKKIWATESGSDLVKDDGGDETRQATHLATAMKAWLTYPWAGQFMVYSYKQALEGYNLVRSDWSPRPAWYAFQSAPKQ